MAIRILTKKGVENTNIDGARQNNFNAEGHSGIIEGAYNEGKITLVNQKRFSLDSCELLISGHRVVIDSPEYLDLPVISLTENTPFNLIAQVMVLNNNVSFSWFVQKASISLIQQNLFNNESTALIYQILLGTFDFTTNGTVSNFIQVNNIISKVQPQIVFTPHVSNEGIISWTNNGNLSNPPSVNIKGDTGEIGDTGEKGDTGAHFTPHISSDGVLSWTNNGNLENPEPVDIGVLNVDGYKNAATLTALSSSVEISSNSTGNDLVFYNMGFTHKRSYQAELNDLNVDITKLHLYNYRISSDSIIYDDKVVVENSLVSHVPKKTIEVFNLVPNYNIKKLHFLITNFSNNYYDVYTNDINYLTDTITSSIKFIADFKTY